MGQDLRQLHSDGAPAGSLHGSDLNQQLWDIGFELFNDKRSFKPTFSKDNLFAEDTRVVAKKETYDIIHNSDFLHLFSWNEQVTALAKMLSLLKQKPGSMIFGRQIAVEEPFIMRGEQAVFNTVGTEQFLHTGDSFMKLLNEVERATSIPFSRSVECYTYRGNILDSMGWSRRIRFTLELLDFGDVAAVRSKL